MLILRRRSELIKTCGQLNNVRKLAASNLPATQDDEYTAEPQYPEIKDLSFRAKKQAEAEHWHESLRKPATVEEKLIKINLPRYYGYKVVNLNDEKFPYDALPMIQHYTRTVFEEKPLSKQAVQTEATAAAAEPSTTDGLVQATKGEVLNALEFTSDYFSFASKQADLEPIQQERLFVQILLEQLNRVLTNALAADYQHLTDSDVDVNPRHEAFWQVGGIDPPRNVLKSKEGHEWQKPFAKDPVDRLMQYKATPYLALRHRKQLAPFKTAEESANLDLAKELPRFKYDPRTLGFNTSYQHGTNIAGHWPGVANNFGYLSFQSRAHLHLRPDSYGIEDFKQVLHAQAVLSSYGWLLAQATNNGFNTYNDLTYPMNTQTIITNGRDWSFYEYQLNTLLLHSKQIDENPLVNFCRGTGEMQLFKEFDSNGKCVGFNENVLRHLIEFYTNAPTIARNSDELQPFLLKDYKYAADLPDVEQREFLEKTFKHMCSNRPRHLALPEIYLWEKIYKIDNKTRPMEAKRRFFELGINPWKRTLDQHQKEYIPRDLRKKGRNDKKNKWKKAFYPTE